MNFYSSKSLTATTITLLLLSAVSQGCKTKVTETQNQTEIENPVEEVIKSNPTVHLEYETKAALGEGAFWNHKTQEFYWIDIVNKKFHIYKPSNKINKSYEMPSEIGTVVPYTNQEAVVALADGIYTVNLESGKLKMFSDAENKMTENRFNDGKCDPLGNLWVGSMHLKQSEPKASLYKINPKGEATKMLGNITISNGIVWTSDNKKMYYIDTPTGNIRAFDYDITNGTITNERVAVKVPESLGYPDGMAIDEEDMIWVGLWNGNSVVRFNPNTGELLQQIKVPAHNVTACAFGGENLDEMYITTARVDMSEEELEKYPLAGSIFKVKPGVKGVKSAFFGNATN